MQPLAEIVPIPLIELGSGKAMILGPARFNLDRTH
jgi:hypothetical protein